MSKDGSMSDKEYNPNSIDAVLSRIEASIAQSNTTMTTFIKRVDDRNEEQDERITRVENEVSSAKAKVAGIATGVGFAGAGLGAVIERFWDKITGN